MQCRAEVRGYTRRYVQKYTPHIRRVEPTLRPGTKRNATRMNELHEVVYESSSLTSEIGRIARARKRDLAHFCELLRDRTLAQDII